MDRFSEAAHACESLQDLRVLVLDAARELGFDYFALLHHASLRSAGENLIRLDNYPAEWALELVQGGLVQDDPVHLASNAASAAFWWTDLEQIIPLGRAQTAILDRSRDFGLGDGLTVPINVPGEPPGSCSFAVRAGARLPRDQFLVAEIVGLHAFEAARRLALPTAMRPRLSRREVQCLRLVSAGKTDTEIAMILGISPETARQYVKRARSAYDVITRAQLVAMGLRDHWVSFDDAVTKRTY